MKTLTEKVIDKQTQLENSEYIAVFEDGSVSEILTQGTIPHPSEGTYVRIFKSDNIYDIKAKLGSL